MQVTTDWVGLIDEWAARFFDELDYRTEAQNALRFAEDMAGLEGITVSVPRLDLTSRSVLTTGWVRGELPAVLRASASLCSCLLPWPALPLS